MSFGTNSRTILKIIVWEVVDMSAFYIFNKICQMNQELSQTTWQFYRNIFLLFLIDTDIDQTV